MSFKKTLQLSLQVMNVMNIHQTAPSQEIALRYRVSTMSDLESPVHILSKGNNSAKTLRTVTKILADLRYILLVYQIL